MAWHDIPVGGEAYDPLSADVVRCIVLARDVQTVVLASRWVRWSWRRAQGKHPPALMLFAVAGAYRAVPLQSGLRVILERHATCVAR
jgi:hypothetical protein